MSTAGMLERSDRVVSREIAGETLLVPIRDNAADLHHVFVLNPVAARIWAALDGPTTAQRLVEVVCATFDVDVEQAERDVTAFLDELHQADLLCEG